MTPKDYYHKNLLGLPIKEQDIKKIKSEPSEDVTEIVIEEANGNKRRLSSSNSDDSPLRPRRKRVRVISSSEEEDNEQEEKEKEEEEEKEEVEEEDKDDKDRVRITTVQAESQQSESATNEEMPSEDTVDEPAPEDVVKEADDAHGANGNDDGDSDGNIRDLIAADQADEPKEDRGKARESDVNEGAGSVSDPPEDCDEKSESSKGHQGNQILDSSKNDRNAPEPDITDISSDDGNDAVTETRSSASEHTSDMNVNSEHEECHNVLDSSETAPKDKEPELVKSRTDDANDAVTQTRSSASEDTSDMNVNTAPEESHNVRSQKSHNDSSETASKDKEPEPARSRTDDGNDAATENQSSAASERTSDLTANTENPEVLDSSETPPCKDREPNLAEFSSDDGSDAATEAHSSASESELNVKREPVNNQYPLDWYDKNVYQCTACYEQSASMNWRTNHSELCPERMKKVPTAKAVTRELYACKLCEAKVPHEYIKIRDHLRDKHYGCKITNYGSVMEGKAEKKRGGQLALAWFGKVVFQCTACGELSPSNEWKLQHAKQCRHRVSTIIKVTREEYYTCKLCKNPVAHEYASIEEHLKDKHYGCKITNYENVMEGKAEKKRGGQLPLAWFDKVVFQCTACGKLSASNNWRLQHTKQCRPASNQDPIVKVTEDQYMCKLCESMVPHEYASIKEHLRDQHSGCTMTEYEVGG